MFTCCQQCVPSLTNYGIAVDMAIKNTPSPALTIAYCQMELAWHDPEKNRNAAGDMMDRLKDKTDIILLPEMFTTGFSMSPESIAEPMDGTSVLWMREQAAKRDAMLTGSIIIEDNGKFFNRMLFCFPDGKVEHYDKRHLFSYAGENAHYNPGSERKLIEFKGWRILGLVCYDLRFPVWSRNTDDYDLILIVANWPKARVHAWNTLLAARAIENQSYVAAVNRIGTDKNGLEYTGQSGIYDYLGQCLYCSGPDPEAVALEISMQPKHEFRQEYNFLADRDRFKVE